MVTTNSLSTDLQFKVSELETSDIPEDRALAAKAGEQLRALVESLLPVLVYVDNNLFDDVRGVAVAGEHGRILVLTRSGQWLRVHRTSAATGQDNWKDFFFGDIIEGLKKAFNDATSKKEAHLKSLARRTELLDSIGELIVSSKQ